MANRHLTFSTWSTDSFTGIRTAENSHSFLSLDQIPSVEKGQAAPGNISVGLGPL